MNRTRISKLLPNLSKCLNKFPVSFLQLALLASQIIGYDILKPKRRNNMQKDYIIYTIGYEGRGIEEFVDRLKEFKVTCLIDVREIPFLEKEDSQKRL